MLKTINVCDRCGRQAEWDSIAAGDTESVDLCNVCLRGVVLEMLAGMWPAEAAAWVKKARTPRPPVPA